MKKWVIVSSLFTVLFASLAWADVGHDHGPAAKDAAPLWVWAVGLGVLALVVLILFRQARRGTLMSERFRGFSHNARLLLLRSPFSGLSVSLIRLLFNLYLLAVGFDMQIGRAHV